MPTLEIGQSFTTKKSKVTGLVQEVVEKVEISDEATVGIYGWQRAKHFFDSFDRMVSVNDRTNNEFYVAPTYNYLIQQGLNVSAENIGKVEAKVFGLGTPEDLRIFIASDKFVPRAEILKHFLK